MSSPKWYRVRKKDDSWSGWYRSASSAGKVEDGTIFKHDSKDGPGMEVGASKGGFSFTKPEEEAKTVHRIKLEPDEYRPQKNKFRRLRSKHGLKYEDGSHYSWKGKSGVLSANYNIDELVHLTDVDLSWEGSLDDSVWMEVLGLFEVEPSRVTSGHKVRKQVKKTTRWLTQAKVEVDRILDSLQLGAYPLPTSLRAIKRQEMIDWAKGMDQAVNERKGII